MFVLSFLYLLIIIMISVGFFTLMERSVLSYIQIRRGPNSVGVWGLLQPFSDGLSLFMKEFTYPLNSNLFIYIFCPFFLLIQSLMIWCLFPMYINMVGFEFSFLFFLACSCLSIYGLIICGWSSNSSYSMLGAVRGVSQAISYEVSLSLILFCYFFLIDSYNFIDLIFFQNLIWFCFSSPLLFSSWLCCCMAETNRTPFDFSEGESELVSGFNIEYSSGSFSVLFISEYSSIIFMSLVSCLVFMGGDYSSFTFFLKLVLLCFFFVWVRSCLPRYRYDSLMYLSWKCFLPFSLNQMVFFALLKLLFIYHFFLLSQ